MERMKCLDCEATWDANRPEVEHMVHERGCPRTRVIPVVEVTFEPSHDPGKFCEGGPDRCTICARLRDSLRLPKDEDPAAMTTDQAEAWLRRRTAQVTFEPGKGVLVHFYPVNPGRTFASDRMLEARGPSLALAVEAARFKLRAYFEERRAKGPTNA